MNTSSNLNSMGQASLACFGSIIVNAVVHPLCTIKNRQMANEKIFISSQSSLKNLKSFYRGYPAICLTESASYAVTFVANGLMKQNEIPPLISAIFSGAIATPVVITGEAIMVNSQVNAKGVSLETLKAALKTSGLIATLLREIPYSIAIFAMPSLIEAKISFSNNLLNHVLGGFISGSFCGAITAPADKIKTLVQAKGLSFQKASNAVYHELTTASGRKSLLNSAQIRAVHVGLAVTILNVINKQLSQFMPKYLKSA